MQIPDSNSITFVIPDVHAFQSGGNIYNKNLITGLQKNGYPIKVIDLADFQKQDINQQKGHYFFDTLYFNQLAQILAKKNEQAPFWLIVHHLESLYPPKNWKGKDYFLQKEKPFLIQFDGFLASSQFTADYLDNYDLPQPKIVIPPAIDYLPTQQFNRKNPPIKALIVANLVERKGILPFLKKLQQSPRLHQIDQLQIQLIGSPNIEKDYAQQCLTLLKNNPLLDQIVHYQGQLSSEQLHAYYQTSNLLISTAFIETYGMAIQEARAFRLPILALDGGNVPFHITEGQTGFLVKELDGLIEKLTTLVSEPKVLTGLQKNIIDKIPDFYTWEQAGIQLLEQI